MPPRKRKVGRPKTPASDKAQRYSTTVPPHVAEHLARLGGGSVSRGLRMAAVESAERDGPPITAAGTDFSMWERRNLERLAVELTAEVLKYRE